MKVSHTSRYYIIQWQAILIVVGFAAYTTLFYGDVSKGNSSGLSLIYRAFHMLLTLYVLLVCKKGYHFGKNRVELKMYIFFMVCYSLRMLLDVFLFIDNVPSQYLYFELVFTIGAVFLPITAVIISRKELDSDYIAKSIFWLSLLTIILGIRGIMTHGVDVTEGRVELNSAQGSLSLVISGCILSLSSFYVYYNSIGLLFKFSAVLGFILGLVAALISGSRGGIVAYVVSMSCYLVLRAEKFKIWLILVGCALLWCILNIVKVLESLSNYFPVFAERMLYAIETGDESGRDKLREDAINMILDYPILGYSYRINDDLSGAHAHNGILQVAVALGLPLCVVFFYFYYFRTLRISFKIVKSKSLAWWGIMAIYVIVTSLFGSALDLAYFGFFVMMVWIVYYNQYNQKNTIKNHV